MTVWGNIFSITCHLYTFTRGVYCIISATYCIDFNRKSNAFIWYRKLFKGKFIFFVFFLLFVFDFKIRDNIPYIPQCIVPLANFLYLYSITDTAKYNWNDICAVLAVKYNCDYMFAEQKSFSLYLLDGFQYKLIFRKIQAENKWLVIIRELCGSLYLILCDTSCFL